MSHAVVSTLCLRIPLALLALLAACGSDGGPTCGKGTVKSGSSCVPTGDALSCGPGTTLVAGQCVADTTSGPSDADTADAADTSGGPDVTSDAPPVDAVCQPNCQLRNCGDDGCGGQCGVCNTPEKPTCNTAIGVCVAKCVPQCQNKNCGDDGCGAVCGTCEGNLTCTSAGRCVPPQWTCNPNYYAAGDACDCGCGAADPDCADPQAYLAGCTEGQKCDVAGTCVSKAPSGWTCPADSYAALDACNCACGAVDPDCSYSDLPVLGCATGQSCLPSGTCGVCTPKCDGKSCGDDGCGGECGSCGSGTTCDEGKCVDPCGPKPLACKYSECGSDGCGGSCGECPSNSTCNSGHCEALALPTAPTSCVSHCGTQAPAGCYCTATCAKNGTCCQDYSAVCSCAKNCAGKQCGPDGCGGQCGTCPTDKPFCGADQQCASACTPKCDGKMCGDNGCGGECGSCGPAATCSWTQQCVPTAWTCPINYFKDGQACDCGCGAVDPDCSDPKALVFGCPTSTTACDGQGLCKISFCTSDAACGGKWCSGVYAAGGGYFKGACATANGLGKAPGKTCKADAECANSACIGGLCRTYCQGDGDCPATQRCLGLAVTAAQTGKTIGFASVCATVNGSAAACTAQKDCLGQGELCQAFVDPKTLGPRFLCAIGTYGGGSSCASSACPSGQLCAAGAKGPVCGLACPGGAADCPGGSSCGSAIFNNHGTQDPTDDPTVATCVQK
ncbi:MAG: hypothetical protein HY902_15330 [Deltaproteobacteria bacterium]|nr:hypothetical protein [Deltaproteobacteria bacterium]